MVKKLVIVVSRLVFGVVFVFLVLPAQNASATGLRELELSPTFNICALSTSPRKIKDREKESLDTNPTCSGFTNRNEAIYISSPKLLDLLAILWVQVLTRRLQFKDRLVQVLAIDQGWLT